MVGLTYLLAVLQMFGPGISLWMTLVFPFWVLVVSIHFLLVRTETEPPVPGDELTGMA
jgi:hypothetical protein